MLPGEERPLKQERQLEQGKPLDQEKLLKQERPLEQKRCLSAIYVLYILPAEAVSFCISLIRSSLKRSRR